MLNFATTKYNDQKNVMEEIPMKFWGKHKKQDQKETLWLEKLPIDTGDCIQVFSTCLGKMTAIQTACGEQVVRDQNWRVDFSRGVICFGEQAYPPATYWKRGIVERLVAVGLEKHQRIA